MFFRLKSVRAAILTAAVLAAGVVADAASVEYYTTGTFSNAATPLMFTPVGTSGTPATLDLTGGSSFASFGEIVNTAGPLPLTLGGTLTIDIFQVSPTAGTASLAGSLTGKIKNTGSTGSFAPDLISTTIGDVTYSFTMPFYDVVPVVSNNGRTSIQAKVDLAAVPEPSSTALFGAGIVVLGLLGRRRFRAAA